jgi:Domain of unknown function (DUF4129)
MQAVRTRTVLAVLALTMLVSVVAIGGSEPIRGTPSGTPEEAEGFEAVPPPSPPIAAEDSEVPDWLLWALAAAVVAVILAITVRLPGKGKGSGGVTEGEEEEVEEDGEEEEAEAARRAVEAALEPLRDPTDPRSAVIAAYARMESALAERRLGRRAPEAPREYLARVLSESGVPERSLTTLTTMFEEARFSLHPIPDSAPRRALGELENARAALAALD